MSFAVFGRESKLLPAFCKPYPDELLSSWITRMAYDHGLYTKKFCNLIWPEFKGHPDVDRYISDTRINQLAEKTNCCFEEVKETTLWSFEISLFGKMHPQQPMENWLISSKNAGVSKEYYSTGLMFCPLCLKKKSYFKKQWRLAISFICIDCGCYLMESCPHCKKGNSFMGKVADDLSESTLTEMLINCHLCGKDITQCKPEPAKENYISLQQHLYSIINKGHCFNKIESASYFLILHYLASFLLIEKKTKMKFRNFINDVFAKNGLTSCIMRSCNHIRLVRDLPVQKRAIVIQLAHWLLEEWPFRLLNLYIRHNIYSTEIISTFKNAPYWFMEPLIDGLNCLLENPDEEEGDEEQLENNMDSKMQKSLRELKYDFDMDNYYYYIDDFENIDFGEEVENYLYEMSMCKAFYG